ncbi:MAG: hypothetical protein ACE5GZ_03795 [Gammaproteobacteria bacterium]
MKISTLFAGIVLGLALPMICMAESSVAESVSGQLLEKCQYPKQPAVPNGREATEEELLTAQKGMKAYLAQGDGFITCIDKIESSWSEEEAKEKRPIVIMFHNRVVDDMNEVAQLFNSAVRAFKGKH